MIKGEWRGVYEASNERIDEMPRREQGKYG
jgi:hypothetical protein